MEWAPDNCLGGFLAVFNKRRVFVAKGIFLCKSSIMSILYRGTANLLVKSAGYAVISCIKGKI